MGGVYGAALAAAGIDTTLVDASEAVCASIRRAGIVVERDGERVAVKAAAVTDAASVGPVDVVIFFTKCYQTRAAATAAAPLVADETAVVSLQNGWGNGDVLAEAFDAERVCVGVSYHSATSLGPGRVAHTAAGPTLVGALGGGDAYAERVVGCFTAAGLEARHVPGVRHEIWKKLVLNAAALPTSALTGLVAAALAEPGGLWDVVEALAREAVAVGRAAGFDVDEQERIETIRGALERAGNGKASMLQDVEAGRRTEIDVINGAVARLGEQASVPTPMNSAMVALIAGYERAHGLQ
jgi:2-dehydropantoate 2-reductase